MANDRKLLNVELVRNGEKPTIAEEVWLIRKTSHEETIHIAELAKDEIELAVDYYEEMLKEMWNKAKEYFLRNKNEAKTK